MTLVGKGCGGLMRRAAVLLSVAVALWAAATALYLRKFFYDYDTRPVTLTAPPQAPSAGRRLDEVLLSNMDAFARAPELKPALRRTAGHIIVGQLWVDRCPVSQGGFQKFVQWQKLRSPQQRARLAAPGQPDDWAYFSDSKDHVISGRLEASANGVAYYDAYAYCQAAGGRLPVTEEWIAVAAGRQGRLYPWGDSFDESGWSRQLWPRLNPLLNSAQRCGGRQWAATPGGVQDMGLLVSEWAQNRLEDDQPSLHGSSSDQRPRELYCLNAIYRRPGAQYRSPHTGFRCVYDLRPVATPWRTRAVTERVEAGQYDTGLPAEARLPGLLTEARPGWLPALRRMLEQESEGDRTLHFMSGEVTRRQYARFLADPLARLGLYGNKNQPRRHSYSPDNWEQQRQEPDLPVSGLDWWSAQAFAAWAGGRLPTAEEWGNALSSHGTYLYPWGDKYVDEFAATAEAGLQSPLAGGSTSGDLTPDGLADMGGNLSEWTQSIEIADSNYYIVIKGGNYLLPGEETARRDFQAAVPPDHRSVSIGLRLVFERRQPWQGGI